MGFVCISSPGMRKCFIRINFCAVKSTKCVYESWERGENIKRNENDPNVNSKIMTNGLQVYKVKWEKRRWWGKEKAPLARFNGD